MKNFLKNIFRTRYFMVKVDGIFREGIHLSSPHQLYFTTLVIPILSCDLQDFTKSPSDYISKAIHEIHPEMKFFTLCRITQVGWYSVEDFNEVCPTEVREVPLRIPIFKISGVEVHPVPIKTLTVVYRTFHKDVILTFEQVTKYIRQYLQNHLDAYFEGEIRTGEAQSWD